MVAEQQEFKKSSPTVWQPCDAYHCSSIPLIGGNTNLTQKKVAYSDTGNSAINLCA